LTISPCANVAGLFKKIFWLCAQFIIPGAVFAGNVKTIERRRVCMAL
jgi:hypothetical protein